MTLTAAPRIDGRSLRRKASDEELLAAYAELGNVHKVGERFGMGGGSAHERLVKLGAARPINVFSDAEVDRLRSEYWIAAETGKLAELAADLGRSKTTICKKARELGLTKKDRTRPYNAVWKYVGEESARIVFEKLKRARGTIGQFCAKNGYDPLGFSRCMKKHFPDEWEHVVELKQIKQTMYRFGRQFEYKVRDDMKARGYFALRSPASKTPIDILAVRPGQVVFIQCKRGGTLRPSEWNELFDLCLSCGAVPILASCPSGRGIIYQRITDRKTGKPKRQPLEDWRPA